VPIDLPSYGSGAKPPYLGFGLGLRSQHYSEIAESAPPVDWFEALSENYMMPGGQPLQILDRIRSRYPIVLHGVSLSIASTAELNWSYLKQLKELAKRFEPKWISDHLCWTGIHGVNLHDLLPIPYTQEALHHIASRVHRVQEFLGCAIVLENVSTYVQARQSEMSEWEFITELMKKTGCWLLLDITNVYVNAFNHGYEPSRYLAGIPSDGVAQLHIAGYTDAQTHVIDTHDSPICAKVWELYRIALQHFGRVSSMIERDEKIPPLAELMHELDRARAIAGECFSPN
jgi:uncharacterized protein